MCIFEFTKPFFLKRTVYFLSCLLHSLSLYCEITVEDSGVMVSVLTLSAVDRGYKVAIIISFNVFCSLHDITDRLLISEILEG